MKLFFASPKTMCLLLPIDTLLRINPTFANASFIRKTSSSQQRHASSNETVHNNTTSPEGSLPNVDTADEKGNDHTLSDHLPATGLSKPNNDATFPTTQPTDCGDRKWYIYQNDNGDINCSDGYYTYGKTLYDTFEDCCAAQKSIHSTQECNFELSICDTPTTPSPTTAVPTTAPTLCADRTWSISDEGFCSNSNVIQVESDLFETLLDCCSFASDKAGYDSQTCNYEDACVTPIPSPSAQVSVCYCTDWRNFFKKREADYLRSSM